jgi:manganese transport protein
MPHNLYLHSSIVQTRKTGDTPDEIQSAIRYNTWDTVISLSLAFFVNAAILILAGTVFGGLGKAVEELDQGHVLLRTALGGASATAFAVALLASGQSSTITGTLAGQIVMEGFTRWKIAPWKRRLLTRSLAIIPAFAIIAWSGGSGTINLLVMSQVVLSMQLPFAIFPLIAITSNRKAMGSFVNPIWMTVLGYATSVLITGLNVFLLWDKLGLFGVSAIAAGVLGFAMWVQFGYSRREAVRVS